MAKIKVEAQTTGAGIYTVKSGTSATSYTATLPDATGTILMTDGDGSSLTGITHTPADNSVTLAKMAHGTDGELITYDAAGAPANVAVGTSGHILTSGGVGVAPTFQAAAAGGGGGSWEFVSRTNVSTTVAGVEFTGLASQPHLLVFEAFVPVSTSAAYLSITVSNDNGSTYYSSGYRWSNSLWSDTSNNSFTASSSDSSLRISTTGDNSNSTQGFNGQIMMFNINDSTQKFMQTSTIVHVSDGHYCRQGVGGGIHDTAAAINAIKLAFHTGNINGHAKCYVTLYKQIIS